MDEAEHLGDRIGVMSEGKLLATGSSVFLKNKFGKGYKVVILLKNENVDFEKLNKKLKSLCSDFEFEEKVGIEVKLHFQNDFKGFSEVLKFLESEGENWGVRSFGIESSSLEDVFVEIMKYGRD